MEGKLYTTATGNYYYPTDEFVFFFLFFIRSFRCHDKAQMSFPFTCEREYRTQIQTQTFTYDGNISLPAFLLCNNLRKLEEVLFGIFRTLTLSTHNQLIDYTHNHDHSLVATR